MEHTLQKLVFILVFGTASRYCVNGNDVGCICAENQYAYISTRSTDDMVMCSTYGTGEKVQNQILGRLDSMLKIIEQQTTLLTSLHGTNTTDALESRNSVPSTAKLTKKSKSLKKKKIPSSCKEATVDSHNSGMYIIQVNGYGSEPFEVFCDDDLYGGGWTVVMRRKDGSVDFFRQWADYKKGFGDLEGEFFIGLDKLYALTNGEDEQELIVIMSDFDNTQKYAKYSSFSIGDEDELYVLKTLGEFSGDAGDSLSYHLDGTFKTKEIKGNNCATKYTGAWWYKKCYESNLFGKYIEGNSKKGISWNSFRGAGYSLKFVQMMIRPK